MTIHSTARPIFHNKVTSLAAPLAGPVVVVDSPQVHKARLVGDGGGSNPESLPLSLIVVNESPVEGDSLDYKLMLMGNPDFPTGIEIYRATGIPFGGGIDRFERLLAIVPGERIEFVSIGDDWTAAKVMSSHQDFSRQIVRVGRVLLDDTFKDIFPKPPVGGQNVPVVTGHDHEHSAGFYTNNGSGAGTVDLVLNDDGTEISRAAGTAVGANAQANLNGSDIVLNQDQSLQAKQASGDADTEIIAITTWLEISEPST